MSRKRERRGFGKKIFRRTAIKTNVKNIPQKAMPRGGIRL